MNTTTIRARLWDKDFKYVPAAETDIRKTFARLAKPTAPTARKSTTVTPIKKDRK
jgi:hypothetical protein